MWILALNNLASTLMTPLVPLSVYFELIQGLNTWFYNESISLWSRWMQGLPRDKVFHLGPR